MRYSSGHWYAVLSSEELGPRPIGRRRFGERLVFWRDGDQQVVCFEDACPHRGAALSLGRTRDGGLQCPFHGFCFDAGGRCTRIPAEGADFPIPEHFRVQPRLVREDQGYVWLWRGPALPPGELPTPPRIAAVAGMSFGEVRQTWDGHYTRCIENVIDYSHLPYVHRSNIGRSIRDPVTRVEVEPIPGGFRGWRLADGKRSTPLEFIYPNVWLLCISPRYVLGATFVPVDDDRTEVYGRWYHGWNFPFGRLTMNLFGRLSQYIVFKDDLPVVASQTPRSVDDAAGDKLVPSDACLVAFRKLRRAHQQELREDLAAVSATR